MAQLPSVKRQVENYLGSRYPQGVMTGLQVSEPNKEGVVRVQLWLSGSKHPFATEAQVAEDGNVVFDNTLPELEEDAA